MEEPGRRSYSELWTMAAAEAISMDAVLAAVQLEPEAFSL